MAELWPGGPLELPHEITIDGHRLVIPEISTSQQLSWLARGAWWEILPAAVELEQVIPLAIRLENQDDYGFDFEHFWEPATLIFAGLAGTIPRDGVGTGWWPAIRLASTALVQWPLYVAWCASHGTGPLDGPLWRVIANVYAWLRDGRDAQDLAKLEQQIWAPPPIRTATDPAELPRHVRDEEASLALAALGEAMSGGEGMTEWTPAAQQ